MQAFFSLWDSIQQYLIPFIEDNLGPLSEMEAEFVGVDRFIGDYGWQGNGRKPHYRKPIALASIAKAVRNLPTAGAD